MRVAGAIVLALAATLAAYLWLNREAPIRYRLSATVESGGKTYTSSTVIQIDMSFQEYWSPPAVPHVTGDALVVEVPGKAPIFFLLTSDWSVDWDAEIPFQMFQDQLPEPRTVRGDTRFLAESTASATIPPERYPLIVAFGDLAKPDSVYELSADDLSPPLDAGARVVSLTIEMTRDRPTAGAVEAMLPWVADFIGYLNGQKFSSSNSLAGTLHGGYFSKRGI